MNMIPLLTLLQVALGASIAYFMTHRFRTRRDIRDLASANIKDLMASERFRELRVSGDYAEEVQYLETLGHLSDYKTETMRQIEKIKNNKYIDSLVWFRRLFVRSVDRKLNLVMMPMIIAIYLLSVVYVSKIHEFDFIKNNEKIFATALLLFGLSYIFVFLFFAWCASETVRRVRTNILMARQRICDHIGVEYFAPSKDKNGA